MMVHESVHRRAALLALFLFQLLTSSLAARIPIQICDPSKGQLQLQAHSNCTAWIPGHPPSNVSSLRVPSNALIHMPNDKSDAEGFAYHMSDSTIGFVFKDYRYGFELPNDEVEPVIAEAAHELHDAIARNPRLPGRALDKRAEYIDPQEQFALVFQPTTAVSMTWKDVEYVFPILASWAEEYQAIECDFEIWRWPGTERKKMLGIGTFVSMG